MDDDIDTLSARLESALAPAVAICTIGEGTPCYDLYHAGFSLCSHKVRTTLAELGIAYRSVEMSLMPKPETRPQCYEPDYVRLRMISAAADSAPVSGFNGTSAVSTEGFDACVVPTLVDRQKGVVVADSLAICHALADAHGGSLVPAADRALIEDQLTIHDRTPHVALLYGADPAGDTRPAMMRTVVGGVHARKVADLEQRLAEEAGDAALVRAYRAKIAKETAAARFVADDAAMDRAVAATEAILDTLDETLARGGGPWLTGDRFTLADIGWGVSLFRLVWLGRATGWGDHPRRHRVATYWNRLRGRPSLRAAVIEWPTLPPSLHAAGA